MSAPGTIMRITPAPSAQMRVTEGSRAAFMPTAQAGAVFKVTTTAGTMRMPLTTGAQMRLQMTPANQAVLRASPAASVAFVVRVGGAPGGGSGTTFTSGSGAPTGGVAGDWYLRTDSTTLYLYQNVAGTWTVRGQLMPV